MQHSENRHLMWEHTITQHLHLMKGSRWDEEQIQEERKVMKKHRHPPVRAISLHTERWLAAPNIQYRTQWAEMNGADSEVWQQDRLKTQLVHFSIFLVFNSAPAWNSDVYFKEMLTHKDKMGSFIWLFKHRNMFLITYCVDTEFTNINPWVWVCVRK